MVQPTLLAIVGTAISVLATSTACSVAPKDHPFGNGDGVPTTGDPGPVAIGSTGSSAPSDTGGVGGTDTGARSGTDEDGASSDEGLLGPKWDVQWDGETEGPAADSCVTDVNADEDGDGYSVIDGDCNDCDANVNPGAIEVMITEPDRMGIVPEPADEDCDGGIDNLPPPCEGAFAIDDTDPYHGAGAMGLCKQAQTPTDWGIVSARYVRANGTSATFGAQTGLLSGFGPNVDPLEGSQSLVLSTGRARLPGQPNACNNESCWGVGSGTAPPGFPQDVAACPGLSNINDDVSLEVTLRAPTNATGFSYGFKFYSFEYPEFVCSMYNDQYIALVTPAPAGAINGNISFDSNNNPVSVNVAFFDVCPGCPLGAAELSGTGFGTWNDAGATGWLTTTAPVEGGSEFTIRFSIWDTGDDNLDSTVLLDNFQWIANGGTVTVATTPEG